MPRGGGLSGSGGLVCGIVIFFAFNLQTTGPRLCRWRKDRVHHSPLHRHRTLPQHFPQAQDDAFQLAGRCHRSRRARFPVYHRKLHDNARRYHRNGRRSSSGQRTSRDSTHFAPKVNILKLNAYQFLIAGLMSLASAMALEDITFDAVLSAAPAICYTAVFSTAIAYSFQAYGQKWPHPTVASIILSTEALFAVIFGCLFLNETLTSRELIGCGLMFTAVILAQIPSKPRGETPQPTSRDKGKAL